MRNIVLCCILAFAFNTISSHEDDGPDVRLLNQIAQYLWDNRHDILMETLPNLPLIDEEVPLLKDELAIFVRDVEPGEQIDCAQCLAAVGTLQTLFAAGLTFDDVRDEAVVVCIEVTAGMGYNGTLMCDGIIDNYGPHVYYVLNTTSLSAREICEFHRECGQETDNWQRTGGRRMRNSRRKQNPTYVTSAFVTESRPAKEDLLRIAHISDVHFDDKYSPGSATECDLPLCCRDYWQGTGIANEWGDYYCGIPTWTVELLLERLAEHNPHFIVQTGDVPPHALWEETQLGQIEYSRWFAEAILRVLPGVPAYTCIGNHEVINISERPALMGMSFSTEKKLELVVSVKSLTFEYNTHALNRNLTEIYAPLSNWTQEAEETMEIAGFYAMNILPGLKVLAINSNFGAKRNYYGTMLPESEGWVAHAQYVENALLQAQQNREKVIMLAHHTMKGKGFVFYDDWINRLVETYGDVILFQLQGHAHTDDIQLSSNELMEPTSSMYSTSTLGTRTDKNPSFRIYYVHPETLLPLQYDHYFLNLTHVLEHGGTPEVELMYSTYEDYGMADLSLASLSDFIDRMIVDDDLFYLYRWNEETRTPGNEPEDCSGECRVEFACGLRTTTKERYEQCMELYGQ